MEKAKIAKSLKIPNLPMSASLLGLGATTTLVGLIGQMSGGNKMFGQDGATTKEIVRDMMEGATTGLFYAFDNKLDDLKHDKKQLQEKVENLETEKEALEEDLQSMQEISEGLVAEVKELKAKKKRKPSPKAKKGKKS